MKELGFKEVYDMEGIVQWREAGFETVKKLYRFKW